MLKKRLYYPVAFLIIVALVGCNLPATEATPTALSVDAAFTVAAQTIEAQLTSGAQTQAAAGPVVTSTPTVPIASETPLAPLMSPTVTLTPVRAIASSTQSCDLAQFITDVTVPDGTNYAAGATFTKTWRVKNTGTCSWTPSYQFAFASGNSMSGPSVTALAGNVNPGESVDISVNLTAPATAGEYTGFWKLQNASGMGFITMFVKINVGDASGGEFAVTSVKYTVTGECGDFDIVAQVTVNGAGSVSYHWVYSNGDEDTTPHVVLEFAAAGTQSVATDWGIEEPGDHWIDLYIDEPNHQQFKRAEMTCEE